jgi:hypothetical protein
MCCAVWKCVCDFGELRTEQLWLLDVLQLLLIRNMLRPLIQTEVLFSVISGKCMYFRLHLAVVTPFPVFMIIFAEKWCHWVTENLIIQLWHKVQILEHFLESECGYFQPIIVTVKYLVKIVKGKTVSQMQFL